MGSGGGVFCLREIFGDGGNGVLSGVSFLLLFGNFGVWGDLFVSLI